uniref:Uncharacterized protein n=1 Tax=Xiphophorus couchianus TaxID=32473 RepID=A0A3B5MBK9_9TELE
ACSLSGSPATTRWYFAVQVCRGATQFCNSDWEELGTNHQRTDSEEESLTTPEECLTSLSNQEAADDLPPLAELLEEAADGLHQLTDKLPPPGKALLDVLLLASAEPSPSAKDLLPLLGALKHMASWQGAKINIVTQNISGWEKVASSLSARLLEPADLFNCIDYRELWRGDLVIREKKVRTEIFLFSLFFLTYCAVTHPLCALVLQVFHYYAPVLDLVQVVLGDLMFIWSFSQVGALFSLSCMITPITQPPASQLSSQRWKECLSRTPKSFLVPDVEVKGERAVYFLLVQGADDVGSGTCRVRLMHSHSQLNGAAAMATLSSLLREKPFSSGILYDKTAVFLYSLLRRERKVAQVQALVLKEYLRQKEETSASCSVPVNDLKAILNLAREQYLKMFDSILPIAEKCLTNEQPTVSQQPSDWPERTVLHNIENLQRKRQRKRLGLLGPGSTESLLGPKDSQRGSSALLDAKELLKHFTSDGLPTGELQPLAISRGNNMFQLSPDLSPRTISKMPFSIASSAHYHGIEFCLDKQRSLDRDQAFVRLQSRLIRYETQTTCSKEPCALPFALSPAPSPAVMSEPGSVPDGETLQNNDVAQLKRRSWDTDIAAGYPRKRFDVLYSSCSSGSSGTHPAIRSLRQQANRSQSASSCTMCVPPQMLQEIVAKTLKHHGIAVEHECFEACSKRLFDISKFYLKDLKTSRGLHDEMKKAASSNVKQVVDWVLEKSSKKGR